MVIDFHTHVFPPSVIAHRDSLAGQDATFRELYANPDSELATADDLLQSMEAARVDKSVALGFAWSDLDRCREHNDYVLASASTSGERLIPFCTVPPAAGRDAVFAEVRRCADAGCRGIGELRPESQGFRLDSEAGEVLARAALDHDLILLFHVSEPVGHPYAGKCGLSPAELVAFAARWPDLRIVAAHWGGGLPFFSLMPEVRERLSNTWFDTAATSLLYDASIYRVGTELAGEGKVLFGSDYPLLSQAVSRKRIEAAGLDGVRAGRILGENARGLLRLL